jgi:hypothetical protein
MPIEGNRIPVKLPFKGATDNSDQFVSMKAIVAKFLELKEASLKDLEYDAKVNKLDKPGTGPASKTQVTVKRRRRPGYRQRSIKITFQTGRPAAVGRVSTLVGNKQKIGRRSYKSIQFPITKSCSMNEILKWFETGGGSGLKVLVVTDVNTGQSYPLAKFLSKT